MLKKERQAHILHRVNVHNRVLSVDLCNEMKVSEDTIRRDLNELAEQGTIIKVHGGALSRSFHSSLQPTTVYSQDKKMTIGKKAAELIHDGMFVLTTGGTTIIEMARLLPESLKATFITGSLPAAMEYIQHPNIDVIFIGDKVSRNSQITVGGEAIWKIRQIKADICLLGINAIDINNGITDSDWEVVQVKKAMVESSEKVVALTISEKINTVQKISICSLKKVDMLITELQSTDPLLVPYRTMGIEIL